MDAQDAGRGLRRLRNIGTHLLKFETFSPATAAATLDGTAAQNLSGCDVMPSARSCYWKFRWRMPPCNRVPFRNLTGVAARSKLAPGRR